MHCSRRADRFSLPRCVERRESWDRAREHFRRAGIQDQTDRILFGRDQEVGHVVGVRAAYVLHRGAEALSDFLTGEHLEGDTVGTRHEHDGAGAHGVDLTLLTSGSADDQIGNAIVVEIGNAGNACSEFRTREVAGHLQQRRLLVASQDRHLTGIRQCGRRVEERRTDRELVLAVAIEITDERQGSSKVFVGLIAVETTQDLAVLAAADPNSAHAELSAGVCAGRTVGEVDDAVTIEVASRGHGRSD